MSEPRAITKNTSSLWPWTYCCFRGWQQGVFLYLNGIQYLQDAVTHMHTHKHFFLGKFLFFFVSEVISDNLLLIRIISHNIHISAPSISERVREGQNIYPKKKHFWHQSKSVSLLVAELIFQNLQRENCRILFSVRRVKSKMGYL